MAAQPAQKVSTVFKDSAPDRRDGASRNDDDQVSPKATSCPAPTVKSLSVLKSSPRVATPASSNSRSGPAMN